jgi:hypothetical protein
MHNKHIGIEPNLKCPSELNYSNFIFFPVAFDMEIKSKPKSGLQLFHNADYMVHSAIM